MIEGFGMKHFFIPKSSLWMKLKIINPPFLGLLGVIHLIMARLRLFL